MKSGIKSISLIFISLFIFGVTSSALFANNGSLKLTGIQQAYGNPGTSVALIGANFDPNETDHSITFLPVNGGSGISASSNNLIGNILYTTVPAGATPGNYRIRVERASDNAADTTATVFSVLKGGGIFTEISTALAGTTLGTADWADYDGDGDLDLLVTGLDNSGLREALIFENEAGAFTENQSVSSQLSGVQLSSVDWGDYDGNGDLDLIITGQDDVGNPSTAIYKNEGGSFSEISHNVIDVMRSSVSWGDYDGDGDLDLVVTGEDNAGNYVATIYENDDGNFTEVATGFTPVRHSSTDWGDYDGDGDLDLVIIGMDTNGNATAKVYINEAGSFTENTSAGLIGVWRGDAGWGDYDNDGDLDLVIVGENNNATPIATIYRNDDGDFTNISAGLGGTIRGSVNWGDIDGDDDLDLVVTGESIAGFVKEPVIYENEDGTFTEVDAGLAGLRLTSSGFGDYDGDGDLDLAISGKDSVNTFKTIIYEASSAPTATDTTLIANENSGFALALSDFGFSDVDDGDQLQTVDISVLPSNGVLYLDANENEINDGEEVSAGDDISRAEIESGKLRYNPAPDVYGKENDAFAFTVSDGLAFAESFNTISIDIHITEITVNGTSGNDGWRMLGSPSVSDTYSDLFDGLWIQGALNSPDPDSADQVYFWDEPTQSWEPLSDFNNTIDNGKGFIAYLYEDDNPTNGAGVIDGGWPKTLSQTGTNKTGPAAFNLSYTENDSTILNGFNMVANPYPFAIDWDAGLGWTKSNISDVIYIWDSNANAGEGAYRTWNGLEGSNPNEGDIAPFQAFWVKAEAPSPVLEATEDVGVSGNKPLLKQKESNTDEHGVVAISIEKGDFTDTIWLTFSGDGKEVIDSKDAFELTSLSSRYLSLFSTTPDGVKLEINNLPITVDANNFELPIDIATSESGTFTLKLLEMENLPNNWEPVLFDSQTDSTISLKNGEFYEMSIMGKKSKMVEPASNSSGPSVLSKSEQDIPRFTLKLKEPTPTSTEHNGTSPDKFELAQNYPNPFNPATTISFALPEDTKVKLQVFDMLGREVATLVNEDRKPAGRHQVVFNASDLASGIYIYRLQAGEKVFTKKLTLIK